MRPQLWLKLVLVGGLALGSGLLPIGAHAETTPTAESSLQTSATVTVPTTKGAPVTVHYRTTTGQTLAADKVLRGDVGSPYDVSIPHFKDRVCSKVTGAVKGQFSTTPSTVTLTYSRLKVTPEPRAATTRQTTAVPTTRHSGVKASSPQRAATTAAPRQRVTTPAKGVVVLSKTPVHHATAATKAAPTTKTAMTRLPQTGDASQARSQRLLSGLILGVTTGLLAFGRAVMGRRP